MLGWLLPLAALAQNQAGELTYESAGSNNLYRVKLRLFRDCAGPAFSATQPLNCRVGSATAACTSTDARNFAATLSLVGTPRPGNPYCFRTAVPNTNQCGPNAPINFEEATYEATVTLPPAPEWTLSWEGLRAPAANLQNTATTPLYLQATLRNQLTLADGSQRPVVNTSAQYQPQDLPVPFVCASQRSTLTFSTYEPDGDSLVYTLDAPLAGCNQPVAYQTFASGGQLPALLQPSGQTCPATLAAGAPSAYSTQFPLPSFSLTGTCPTRQATPSFIFNQWLGSFTFTPAYFGGFDPTDRNRNTYALVGKVTEYRKLNGQYYEVGSIFRNMLVVVTGCEQFQFPNHALLLGPMQVDGSPRQRPLTDLVQVAPGQSTSVVVRATDPDGVHQITLAARWLQPAVPGLPPLQVAQTGPGEIGVALTVPAALPEGRYNVLISAENDNCPRRDLATDTLRLFVTNRPLAAGSAAAPVLTTAAPNPFTDAVTFRLPERLAGRPELTITNVLGQEVVRLPLLPATDGAGLTATWRPAPELPAGVYLAHLPATGQTLRLLRR